MSGGKVGLPETYVKVGEAFQVTLYSQGGSTGYSWYLSGLPECIAFLGETTAAVPPVMAGSKTAQTFTFAAMAKPGGTVAFSLLRPWEPANPADHHTVVVNVSAADTKPNLAQSLKETAGRGQFVGGSLGASHVPPHLAYGFPCQNGAGQAAAAQFSGAHMFPIPPYGFPQSNGAGGQFYAVVESGENCMLAYGFPYGVSTDPAHCRMKYGFPAGGPEGRVIALYSVLPPQNGSNGCAGGVSVSEDKDNCVIKYGFPGGIARDPSQCTLKYGFPHASVVALYAFPPTEATAAATSAAGVSAVDENDANCVVKYGFPNGVAGDPAQCTVKYGFPLRPYPLYAFPIAAAVEKVDETDPKCMVKYGFPNGIATGDQCVLKYGFPSGPVMLYGFPVEASARSAAAQTVQAAATPDQCVVKYGFPGGVALDPNQCTLKYGFPVAAPVYGFPPEHEVAAVDEADPKCVVKYGFPNGIATDAAQCTLKYGFPRPMPKYGFPSS